MFKFFFISLVILLLSTSCNIDIYQIRKGKRNQVFVPELFNNHNGHLFWYGQKDQNGRTIRDEHGQNIIFDFSRDTIIYIHGWQGVGAFGWMDHSLVDGMGLLFAPVSGLISMMYNYPDHGASFPDVKKQIRNYNVALFDYQNYNHIAGESENSENLVYLEENMKTPPFGWPNIPEQLNEELDLLVNGVNYTGNIYIVTHSFGNQVFIRAYDKSDEKIRSRIKKVLLLDPFTTEHYKFMSTRMEGDHTWLTGFSSDWIKNDLISLIQNTELASKTTVISSSDIGEGYAEIIAKPAGLKIISTYKNKVPMNLMYAYRTKRLHAKILDHVFPDEAFNDITGWK